MGSRMQYTRESAIERLLKNYEPFYDIHMMINGDRSPITARCDFFEHSGRYVISKKAELWTADNEEFLYLIKSVFAPMIAVMIADLFFNKKRRAVKEWDWANLAVWLIGLILYRALMHVDIIIGYTLPDIVITAVLCMVVHRILPQNHLDKAI